MRVVIAALALAVSASALLTGCKSPAGDQTPTASVAPAMHEMGAAAVDQKRILNADKEPGSWLAAGRDYNEQRFSPLTQINDKNIGSIGLGLSWYADIDTERGQESTPIIVDGVMYLTTAWSMVKA